MYGIFKKKKVQVLTALLKFPQISTFVNMENNSNALVYLQLMMIICIKSVLYKCNFLLHKMLSCT